LNHPSVLNIDNQGEIGGEARTLNVAGHHRGPIIKGKGKSKMFTSEGNRRSADSSEKNVSQKQIIRDNPKEARGGGRKLLKKKEDFRSGG